MLAKFQINEIVFDDQITLLKPLGYNYVTFYQQYLKIIVIFHPALKTLVKSFKVEDVQDYSFRDDRKYFYTTDEEQINVYQIQDDNYFLLCKHQIRPIGFQWNYILCMKEIWPDSLSELFNDHSYENSYDHSCDQSYESYKDKVSDSSYSNYIELSLIKLRGQLQSNFRIKDQQEDKWSILEKFYLLIQEDTEEYLPYQHYHVMINNKPLIKFHVICDEIADNNQLKQSNYYLSRIIGDEEYLLIMTKQSRNCKIIRKIILQYQNSAEKLVYNYRQVLQFIDHKQTNQVQLINLWNQQKQNVRIDSLEKTILTKNSNMLVSSEKNCLRLIKMN